MTPIDYVQRYDIVFPCQEYVELHLPGVVHLPVVELLLAFEQTCHRMITSDVHQYNLGRRDDSGPFLSQGHVNCICLIDIASAGCGVAAGM